MLLMQQVHGKLFVVGDGALFQVDAGEDVKRRGIFDHRKAIELPQSADGGLPLFIKPAAGHQQRPGAIGIRQGGGNDQLRQGVAAKPHTGKRHHAGDEILRDGTRTGNAQPPAAEPADHMAFGKAVEGQHRQIRTERGGGNMGLAVHDQAVVDLIREEDQLLFPGQRHDLLQQLTGIQGAGGIVGIDDKDGAGAGGDLAADILDIGIPVGLLIAGIKDGFGSGDQRRVGPQRVAGAGQQDLIAVVEQRRDGELSHFADTVADENILGRDPLNALGGLVFRNGAAGGGHSPEIAVADRAVGVFQQRLPDAGRHGKAEGGRVAGVQAQDGGALRNHLHGLDINGAADIGVDLREFFGADDRLHNRASLQKDLKKDMLYCITIKRKLQSGVPLFYEKIGEWCRSNAHDTG